MIFVFDTSIITYGAILFCIFSYNYFTLTNEKAWQPCHAFSGSLSTGVGEENIN